MNSRVFIERVIQSRAVLRPKGSLHFSDRDQAAEGGCGVIGLASSEKVAGKHMLQALIQMRNRGNGKGGGIAAAGLEPDQFGVTQDVLESHYLLAIAYLDADVRRDVEQKYIDPFFVIRAIHEPSTIEEFRELPGLEVQPPEVVLYFARIRDETLTKFRGAHSLNLPDRQLRDEFVYQNSVKLNSEFYKSTGQKLAFVLSHGRNLLVMKMVGYGDDVIRYYRLEDVRAHVWIGHHRYPTKGRVWHPGGAHPFVGLNEALVHNGDFANYSSMAEYLAQRHIYPLFLTDTEVSVQVFDLLHRTYGYPLEHVIEALAPTTERDFTLLPEEKQWIYRQLQTVHVHSSPDGPWFFLIAQSDHSQDRPAYRLTGITDTSMLRPQVFAWQQTGKNGPAIGFAASEKQAIDAALKSLSSEDGRFWRRADRYWNARGGSHTDGGAFIFSVNADDTGKMRLTCSDKFGRPVVNDVTGTPFQQNGHSPVALALPSESAHDLVQSFVERCPEWSYDDVLDWIHSLESLAVDDESWAIAREALTALMDHHFKTGNLRRSSILALLDECLERLVQKLSEGGFELHHLITGGERWDKPGGPGFTAVIGATGFAAEGQRSLAIEIVRLANLGYRKIMVANTAGHRFIGSGLGPNSDDVRIDVYGSSGDYLASGIDGATVAVHGSAQDQLAQIMKAGRLVVYGDVGQTFMYGAKGGTAFVLGNAAGRPLINAVGKPRVVINGTCLDYLAESFMAGDPHNEGGFVIMNGVQVDDQGRVLELPEPYPGSNLFSLASGGAIYIRDPRGLLSANQLNGGEFVAFEERDWGLIGPYLEENEAVFGVTVDRLLSLNSQKLAPEQVYRKIRPVRGKALQAEEAWVADNPKT